MLTDTFVKRIPAWRFWVIGNAIGESIGRLCGFIVSLLEITILYYVQSLTDPYTGRFLTKAVVLCVTSVAIGGAVGLAQYQVLKKLVPTSGQWILACVVGLMIGRLLTFFLFQNLTTLIQPIFVGFFTGLLQWILLRKQVAAAGWWIGAVTLSEIIAWIIEQPVRAASFLIPQPAEPTSQFILIILLNLTSGVIVGTVFGAVTGYVLVLLLPRFNRAEHVL